jgi:hypothetical protein
LKLAVASEEATVERLNYLRFAAFLLTLFFAGFLAVAVFFLFTVRFTFPFAADFFFARGIVDLPSIVKNLV